MTIQGSSFALPLLAFHSTTIPPIPLERTSSHPPHPSTLLPQTPRPCPLLPPTLYLAPVVLPPSLAPLPLPSSHSPLSPQPLKRRGKEPSSRDGRRFPLRCRKTLLYFFPLMPSGRPFTRHHFLAPLHSSVNGCILASDWWLPLCICQSRHGDWLAQVACAYPRVRGPAAAGLPLCALRAFFTPLAAPAVFSPRDWPTDCSGFFQERLIDRLYQPSSFHFLFSLQSTFFLPVWVVVGG